MLKNFFESYTSAEPHPAPVVQQLQQQQHLNGGHLAAAIMHMTL